MKNNPPNSIKIVGLIIIIFSSLIILGNTMGMVAFYAIGISNQLSVSNPPAYNPMSLLIEYYNQMCLIMIIIGLMYLFGGIFIRKYRLWANKLVSLISILLIVIIWLLIVSITFSLNELTNYKALFSVFIVGIVWSFPMGFLVWFLNKKSIKNHFE